MAIGASTIETALDAVMSQSIEAKLLRCKKAIVAVESENVRASHRLGQALRRVLRSVLQDKAITDQQKEVAADLYQRQRKFDPRVLDRKAEQEAEQADQTEAETIDLSDPKARLQDAITKNRKEKSIPDGYNKDVIDLPSVITRVRDRFPTTPKYEDDVLAVALPGATDELIVQLFLALAYWFKNLGGAFVEGQYARDLLPQEAQWIVNSLARKSRTIAFPRPNCFSISEEIAFRTV